MSIQANLRFHIVGIFMQLCVGCRYIALKNKYNPKQKIGKAC